MSIWFRKLSISLSFLILVIGFQNCGLKSSFLAIQNLSFKDSGNGGGYEGKPNARYYHYVPNYTCEGQPSPEQVTEIKDGQAYLYANTTSQCANQNQLISNSDIVFSPFQNDFISVNDKLFKRYEVKPVGVPDSLAEILCRDNFENPTYEIISHFDRVKNEALTRIYFSDKKIEDFAVSRILSMDQLQYVSKVFSLTVNLKAGSTGRGKFDALIEKSEIAKVFPGPLTCIVGGSMDTSHWSLKPLTTVDAGPFHLRSNGEVMFFSEISRNYFSSNFYTSVQHVFKIGLDGLVEDFTAKILGPEYNIKYYVGPVHDDLFVFAAKVPNEGWTSLYVYDSVTNRSKKLTNLVTGGSPEAYTRGTPVLTNDRKLIYDTMVAFSAPEAMGYIRVYDMVADTITELAAIDTHYSGYFVNSNGKTVSFFWNQKNNMENLIETHDLNNKQSTIVPVKAPAGCRILMMETEIVTYEDKAIGLLNCGTETSEVVRISLLDGSVKLFGKLTKRYWVTPDQKWIVMAMDKGSRIVNLKTEEFWDAPVDPYFLLVKPDGSYDDSMGTSGQKIGYDGSRYIFGFGGNYTSPTAYKVDTQTGKTSEICSGASGRKLDIGILPDQRAFLFTYDSDLKVYRFYQAKADGTCTRINEFPSQYPTVPKYISTNIGFALLLGNPLSNSTSVWTREAVFVPIDGRPPLKFNSDGNSNWEMDVSPSKNRIILRGPDAQGTVRIFSFDL